MAELKVKVREKRAYSDQTVIVCGNDDYVVLFDWDDEWDSLSPMMVVVCQDGTAFPPIAVSGKKAKLPSLNTQTVAIGLISGDTRTTTAAVFRCLGGVQDNVTGMVEMSSDFYDILLERLEITSTEKFRGEDGHSPVVTADKTGITTTIKVDGSPIAQINDGNDGKTPTKGTDYWTEEDKQEILNELDASVLPAVTEADNGKIMQVVNGKWTPVESSGGGSVYLTTVNGSVSPEAVGGVLSSFGVASYAGEGIEIEAINYGCGLTLQFLTSEPITEWTTDLLNENTPISMNSVYVHVIDNVSDYSFYANAGVHSAMYEDGNIKFDFCPLSETKGMDLFYCGSGWISFSDFPTWVSRSKVCVQKVG